jgi:hypothetical protein
MVVLMATLLAEHTRKAAHGRHRCGWCDEYITAGEHYNDQRVADEGTVYTWREHFACRDRIWPWLRKHGITTDDFYDPWEVWQEMLAEERAEGEQ